MTHRQAHALLLLTSVIWGFAFVPQRIVAAHLGACACNGTRFLLGSLLVAVAARWLSPGGAGKWPWREGAILGVALFGGAALQQIGLAETTAGKAGFITGLYVVIVPLFGLLLGQMPTWSAWAGAVLAVFGTWFLSVNEDFSVSRGDLFELAGAVVWAVHVQLTGRYARRVDPVRLAALQFLMCAVLSLVAAALFERNDWGALRSSIPSLLYLGVLSVGVGYTLQVVAQRYAEPTPSAIILSLEALFSAVGGAVILGESLGGRGIFGAALMLSGMMLAQLPARPEPEATPGVATPDKTGAESDR